MSTSEIVFSKQWIWNCRCGTSLQCMQQSVIVRYSNRTILYWIIHFCREFYVLEALLQSSLHRWIAILSLLNIATCWIILWSKSGVSRRDLRDLTTNVHRKKEPLDLHSDDSGLKAILELWLLDTREQICSINNSNVVSENDDVQWRCWYETLTIYLTMSWNLCL